MEDKQNKGSADDNKERNTLTPMMGVIADIKDRGYTKEFIVRDGKLKDMETEKFYDSDSLRVTNEYRFEGTSDPDYMGILYTIASENGDKGYITNAYGVYSDEEVDNFIKKIEKVEDKDGTTNKKI